MADIVEQILDVAKWAPSGDNLQPWRFEIVNDRHFIVNCIHYNTGDVYDLQGRATQLALGALIENIELAAHEFGLDMNYSFHEVEGSKDLKVHVYLTEASKVAKSPLYSMIKKRVTQRRPLKTIKLSTEQKRILEESIGESFSIVWKESTKERLQVAKLLSDNGKLRLKTPEAYTTHKAIIEWNSQFSEEKIPDQALGLDQLTLKIMARVIESWNKVKVFNKYFMGTVIPRLELDFLPGFFCAAHLIILANEEPKTVQDFINAGRATQRFWLTATFLNLQMQPEMTPVIFSKYSRQNVVFSKDEWCLNYAKKIAKQFSALLKEEPNRAVFMARVGFGKTPKARSIRMKTEKLVTKNEDKVEQEVLMGSFKNA